MSAQGQSGRGRVRVSERDRRASSQAQGRLRDELTDVDLVAQTIWSAIHGVVSLEIAKCNDDGWTGGRSKSARDADDRR